MEIDLISELSNYLHRIEDLRRQIKAILAGLPAEALNWRPLAAGDDHSTNSLAVLAVHTAGAERFWIGEVVGRKPASRDRDAEFSFQTQNSSDLDLLLDDTGEQTRQILSALTPADLDETRVVSDRTVAVRWGILHVIDHTALHLGHMQLTYQLWKGGPASASPFWYERLPSEPGSK